MSRRDQSGTPCDTVNSGGPDHHEAEIIAEYNALRAEIIHRMSMRHQIVAFSVVVLGSVLAFEAPVNTLLAYPILGLFLALGWAHNDFRIGEIGEYIRTQIEAQLPGLGWETHFFRLKKRKAPLRYVLRASILSAGGIIMGTQLLALVVPICQEDAAELSPCLIIVDVSAIATTAVILHWRKLLYWRKLIYWRKWICLRNRGRSNMNRAVLFVPKSELEAYFKSNARQDVKIVVSALMTEMLSAKLRARGKAVKDEVPFTETHWRHSSAEEPNRVCPSADFADDLISLPAAGPFAMSFAAPGAVETFHHHKEHWEIYFSEHRIGAEYRLPGLSRPEETILEDGGAIVFGPSISHRMKIHGLTVVLEVPAVAGDRETDS